MSTQLRRKAVVSVFDKTGLTLIAAALARHDIDIISTGGTAKQIRDAGIEVTEVSQFTGFPEIFDGRLKTIHPKIAGGLLYERHKPLHVEQAAANGIEPIDFLIVNLYPFEGRVKFNTPVAEAIEFIDIGGPGMIRGAAKNFESVTVVCNPENYAKLAAELDARGGETTRAFRMRMAVDVFDTTSDHDIAILDYLFSQLEKS